MFSARYEPVWFRPWGGLPRSPGRTGKPATERLTPQLSSGSRERGRPRRFGGPSHTGSSTIIARAQWRLGGGAVTAVSRRLAERTDLSDSRKEPEFFNDTTTTE